MLKEIIGFHIENGITREVPIGLASKNACLVGEETSMKVGAAIDYTMLG